MSTAPPGAGRARGRARGRSRGGPPADTRRPGEPAPSPAATDTQRVGRGRGRAAVPPITTPTAAAVVEPPSKQLAPGPQPPGPTAAATPQEQATEAMERMTLNGDQRRPPREQAFVEPHTRPQHIQDKRGTTGQEIPLHSNYIVLNNRPNCAIYQYNVGFAPQVESRRARFGLLRSHEESLLGRVRTFDGMILFLPKRLPQDVTEVYSKLESDDSNIKITITLTNELHANSPVCLQLFNTTFRRILAKLKMRQIGRHYYNPDIPVKIPQHRLELWPGFITSILQYERNVMLGLDISHKILRTDTVYDFLLELYQTSRDFHDEAIKKLVGEIVLTRYNNKTYRIDDINWDMSPSDKFKLASGRELSFVEYYKEQYNADIHDLKQPLLVSQPKKREIRARGGDMSPILLVPELCTRTGLSEEARADFRVMKDVAIYTRIPPQERCTTIMKFANEMQQNTEVQEILKGWNLEFEKNLVRFSGRVLPPETIYQKNARYSYKPADAEWSREMRGNALISSISLYSYLVLFSKRDAEKAEDFVNTLTRVGGPMGIKVDNPTMCGLPDDRSDAILRTLKQELTPRTQMVIVILSTNRKDRYDAVKKFCCVDSPVPSQCILGKTLSKKNMLMSVTTKVALQINCKLGGELWALEIPMKKVMVVGIDSYHDSGSKGRSVGGFIASTNNSFTRYFCQCKFQHTGQELADNLKTCMTNALRKYHEVNGALPDRIIVYRDGVGDGQLPVVVEHEVPQLLESFKLIQPDYNPKFAIVVVKKRINSRFFMDQRGQLANPPPGTIVDTEVTKPEWYDFFLVSQSVRQGTVTPTHFNVIYDTSGLKPDHMQRLTYKLCHLYYNWPGTVRVPAPCQYAHKLAFLVGQSIHKEPHSDLADRLYFL